MFRSRRQQSSAAIPATVHEVDDQHAAQLAVQNVTRWLSSDRPILADAEALLVVALLEDLIAINPSEAKAELARTLIIRILDRLEPDTPHGAGGEYRAKP